MNENPFDPALEAIRAARAVRQEERVAVAAKLREIDVDIRRLTTAEKALSPVVATEPRRTSVEVAREIMTERDSITQAQLTKILGGPKNTARHALERLEEEGLLERTGRLIDRSPEFALVSVPV